MSTTINSPRHHALIELLIERRKSAGLTQSDVAKKLRRYQSHVAIVESGQRRVDVVEFLEFARAIGFDAQTALAEIEKVKPASRRR